MWGPGCTPYCFSPTVDSDHSVGADPSRRCKSASMDGNGAGAGLCRSFFCWLLASTLDDGSIGFSTLGAKVLRPARAFMQAQDSNLRPADWKIYLLALKPDQAADASSARVPAGRGRAESASYSITDSLAGSKTPPGLARHATNCREASGGPSVYPYVGFCGQPAGESSKSCCRP
jgi:hypothetical protein